MNLKKTYKTILTTTIILFITFIALEIVLRVIDPFGVVYFNEVNRYFSNMQPKESYAYIHPVNYTENYQGVEILPKRAG